MKSKIIITVMLAAALQVSAQTHRSRTSTEQASSGKKTESAVKSVKESNTENKSIERERNSNERKVTTQTSDRRTSRDNINRTETSTHGRTSTLSSSGGGVTGKNTVRGNTTENRSTTSQYPRTSRDSYNNTIPRTVSPPAPREPVRTVTQEREKPGVKRSEQSVRGDEYRPMGARESEQARKTYETPARKTVVRKAYVNTGYIHRPVEYRRTHYPYRVPVRVELYWTIPMYREYRILYPEFNYWYYPVGYRIHTISAYDAELYVGEIARVYGSIYATWYSRPTDEYYLYIGGPYPYQDLSIIIPGKIARRYNWRPERYFLERHISVTGLISRWEGKPEMLIRKRTQIEIY